MAQLSSSAAEFEYLCPVLKTLPKFHHVLEIGCGEGAFTRFLAERYEKVTAADSNLEAICIAKQNLTNLINIDFHGKSGEEVLSYIGNIDAVFFYRSLHFVVDCDLLLLRIRDKLPPDGHLIILHKAQTKLFYTEDTDISYLLSREYESLYSNLFHKELSEYWDSTTTNNFIRYCAPDRPTHNLPLEAYSALSVAIQGRVSLLDLRQELLESTVAKRFVRVHGIGKFDEEFQSFMKSVCSLLDYQLENVLFEEYHVEKRSYFYIQINVKTR